MRKKWVLHNHVNSQNFTLYPQCRAQINDPVFVKYFVLDSQGIALVPLTEVKNELDNGEAVRILPDWKGEVRDIFLIWLKTLKYLSFNKTMTQMSRTLSRCARALRMTKDEENRARP